MEIIKSARTVELAIQEACEELSVNIDDIEYEILEEPKKSFLGLKSQLAKVKVTVKEKSKSDIAVKYLRKILDEFGMKDVQIECEEKKETLNINLVGVDSSYLIGRRGETLDALQYLVSLVANRGEANYFRVSIDTNNYRDKREKTLQALARRLSNQVEKTGRSVTLEPMNPYERRIIHATVQELSGVKSASVGEEPNRKVVISSLHPKKFNSSSKGNQNHDRVNGSRKQRPSKQQESESLIKDDFLTSSSTIEGLKNEKMEKIGKSNMDAADNAPKKHEDKPLGDLPLYSKIEL